MASKMRIGQYPVLQQPPNGAQGWGRNGGGGITYPVNAQRYAQRGMASMLDNPPTTGLSCGHIGPGTNQEQKETEMRRVLFPAAMVCLVVSTGKGPRPGEGRPEAQQSGVRE